MNLDELQSAYNCLQLKYEGLRIRAERRERELEWQPQQATELQECGRLSQELEASQQDPSEQLEALRKAHVSCCQQVEILAAECARRYPALQLSEERGRTIEALQRALVERTEERDQLAACVDQLQAQLRQGASSLAGSHPAPRDESLAAYRDRIQQLERELEEARDEAALSLLQLRLVEEELEQAGRMGTDAIDRYLPESDSGAQSIPSADALADAGLINANRSRLLISS